MAARPVTFPKNAWAKELVLVVSFAIWGLAVSLPTSAPAPSTPAWSTRPHPTTTERPSEMMGTCLMCLASQSTPRAQA
uniref:NADH dehydrogenase [ubiquinone] 1 alpha subcomplex subunit 3 n=1 Tax=Equus asinus TaxID=9793 RepID=A0A8C4NA46_EQUAS